MKLSEKGLEKVQNYSSVDFEIEGFEPDDFEDCVVLTLEEAEKFYLDLVALIALQPISIDRLFFAWKKLKNPLKERGNKNET